MLSSADTARDAVVRAIIALERSCLAAENALTERRWPDVEAAFADQALLTSQLAALFAGSPETSPAGDEQVAQRIDGVLTYREGQLERLRAYHAEVATRLESIGKVRAFSRSIGTQDRSGALYDTQQ
jgi:hypothetical protein